MNSKSQSASLVLAAKKCARLSAEFYEADRELKRLMEARYGAHDEMPDDIVEVTQYGGNPDGITIQWLDEAMHREGHTVQTNKKLA